MNTIIVTKKQATELLKGLKEINIVMLSSKESIITDTRIAKTKEPIGDLQGLSVKIEHDNRAKNIKSILAKGFTLKLENDKWEIDKELITRTTKEKEFFTEQFKGEKPHKLELSEEDYKTIKKIAKAPLDCQKIITFVECEEGVRAYGYEDIGYGEEGWETILETSKISSGTKISLKTNYIVEMLDDKDEKTLSFEYDNEVEDVVIPVQAGEGDYVMPNMAIEYREKLESNWCPRTEQEEAEWLQVKAELEQQKESVREHWIKKNNLERFFKEKEKVDDLTRYVDLHNVLGQATYYNKWNGFAQIATENEKSCKISDIKYAVKRFLKKYEYDLETEKLAEYKDYYKYLELDEDRSLEENARLIRHFELIETDSHSVHIKENARLMKGAKTTKTEIGLSDFGFEGTIEGTIIDWGNEQKLLEYELFYHIAEQDRDNHIIADAQAIIDSQEFIDKALYCEEHKDILQIVAGFVIAKRGSTDRIFQSYYNDILKSLCDDYNEGEYDLDRLISKEHDNVHIDYGYADLRVYSLTDEDLEKIDWGLLYSYQNDFESEIRNLLYDKEFLGKYAGKIGIYSRKQKDIFVYERWEETEYTKDIESIFARHIVPKEILQKVAYEIKRIATMYVECALENAEEENEQ